MKRESLITWAIIIGLLLFAGIASAVLPFILDQVEVGDSGSGLSYEPEEEPVVMMLEDYVLGDRLVQLPLLGESVSLFGLDIGPLNGTVLSQLQAAGILTGIVLIAVVVAGAPLALIYVRLGQTVEGVREAEDFKLAQAELSQKVKARTKTLQDARPVSIGQPPERRRRWSAVFLGFMILVIVWFSALTLGNALYEDEAAAGTFTLVSIALAALIMVLLYGRRDLGQIDEASGEDEPINWGMLWVVLSGLLIVGVGMGLTFAIRGG